MKMNDLRLSKRCGYTARMLTSTRKVRRKPEGAAPKYEHDDVQSSLRQPMKILHKKVKRKSRVER